MIYKYLIITYLGLSHLTIYMFLIPVNGRVIFFMFSFSQWVYTTFIGKWTDYLVGKKFTLLLAWMYTIIFMGFYVLCLPVRVKD